MTIYPFSDKRKAIQRNEPIELNGLVYYPILVSEYEKFLACKPALLLRQGTLPAVYAVMSFLASVWAFEIDMQAQSGESAGLWGRLMGMLALALQFSEGDSIKPIGNLSDPRNISAIQIKQGETVVQITPKEFNVVRQLIAEQNGEKLPDETDTPDLLEAIAQKAEINGANLDLSFDDLIAAIACHSHLSETKIWDWTIKEFETRRAAIDRYMNFVVCNIGMMSGNVSWKDGNPYPSWCYARVDNLRKRFLSEDSMVGDFSKVGNIQKG